MTRIRKLFLGIFLMVFTLGIGVFIFVQVDSKDAGTGKSRPLSMAEKILKYGYISFNLYKSFFISSIFAFSLS